MKILVHDYAGHPFQVQLSRQLAIHGHRVTHVYFAENPGPKGAFERLACDPETLRFVGVTIGRGYDKSSLVSRRFNDVEYGRRVKRLILADRPEVVISGNTPTEAQQKILRACQVLHTGFVYWLQDFYSIAVTALVSKRLGRLGLAIGWYYRALERSQLRRSDTVIAITDDFVPLASAWAGDSSKVAVIENWAALDDIQPGVKSNGWSREHGLDGTFNFLYCGTLGLKHDPVFLIELAQRATPDVSITAVAEGVGATQLTTAKAVRWLDRLQVLPLQHASQLADVLATADVLVAMIESDAGTFAVPSKVQSYMCAGRPILLAAPKGNLAARTVVRENAGIVVEPGDKAAFLTAAQQLRTDPALRARLGANGRRYAERAFDITQITKRFESILRSAAKSSPAQHRTSNMHPVRRPTLAGH